MANLPQIIGDIPVHSMRKFFVQVKELHSNIIKRKEITENLESPKMISIQNRQHKQIKYWKCCAISNTQKHLCF